MRTVLAVVLLSLAAAAKSAGQDGPPQNATGQNSPASDSAQPGLAPEPHAITKVINWFDRELNQGGGPKDGFYPELGNMITGSGWISAGPGYRHQLAGGRAIVTASTAVSWKFYKMAQARFELPHLANDHVSVGSQVIYQDMLQVNYFGLGNDSLKANRSGYRLDETDVLGYATVRPTDWLSVNGRSSGPGAADWRSETESAGRSRSGTHRSDLPRAQSA